ncbi:hypothetical protein JD844_005114 [Phrynosoma platyrhinos]|uniref:Uncharacterized protein n=1 Tax=Phrynosoma platyrhinos TaxID=52577 RepID=A0ABQ7SEG0_PHRPL|nr:hypothetical protein JD844_005114 [Phrynosoma platyrhinos]
MAQILRQSSADTGLHSLCPRRSFKVPPSCPRQCHLNCIPQPPHLLKLALEGKKGRTSPMAFLLCFRQLLRPVYQDSKGPPGGSRTHSKKSQLMKTVQTFKGHGDGSNPQTCTLAPHSTYGTYVTLAPKVLIFPIFVQPLDLCNPARTLVLAEELLLHEIRNKPTKVTLFIYSDLLLFTQEEEPGRCHVLRNPLYLRDVRLQEGESAMLMEGRGVRGGGVGLLYRCQAGRSAPID